MRSDHRLRFGVCWYPDHWPRERWETDLRLMRDAGIECVRWGEGSWTLMQPSPGRFDWSFVDDVLELCARQGLGVILGTPTYAAPAWLEEAHPEIIARRENGSPWYRHSRRYYDYTQPAYRAGCDAIVHAMAERYASDERVWAWQLDNEMWCHLGELWGESARRAFQHWLARRYGAVAALNDAWGLAFWSNQLDHFGQADLPGPTTAYLNHHQCADYRHFLSDLAIDFLARQRELIVAHDSSALVLHNCPFGPIDRARLLEGLDIYGHDHYPRFAGAADERPAMGLNYGRFRAYAKRLWVVEQQASQVGQTSYRFPAAPPGELAVTALQSIGHGCNLLAWFRWRSFPAAQETNWGGLLPHWGEPGRHYREACALIAALAPHAELIASTRPVVAVARLVAYRQQVAAEVEPWIGAHLDGVETGRRALRRLGANEDTLRPRDLKAPATSAQASAHGAGYALAILPLAVALDDDDLTALTRFVHDGGVLIVGPLAGHRDVKLQASQHDEPPGALRALTGTSNAEATTLDEPALVRCCLTHADVESTRYAEIVEPRSPDVEVLAEHARGWFAGSAAIVQRSVGAGCVIHSGVALNDAVVRWLWQRHIAERLARHATPAAPISPPLELSSAAAEVLTRSKPGAALHFVLNHGAEPVACELHRATTDLLSGADVPSRFELAPFGYRILHERLETTPSTQHRDTDSECR
ncbi:MAG TPA: beta-galactosidase [Polyangiaceae bacterium]|nr:beta-galactosidase [Polyangiaceae bacterium]